MEAPSQSAAQEARQLNITLEQEDGEWIAVLPPHPDLKDDEAMGFPAPSEQEALDEARAYRSIEQSKVFKFEYDEKRDLYVVSFADQKHEAKFLAPAYREAQKAYAEFINKPEPPKAAEPAPVTKPRRKRTTNGGEPPREQITSGIGDKPTQLAPPIQTHEDIRKEARTAPTDQAPFPDPWSELNERVTKLENILRDALVATAKALEELKNR